MSKLLTQLASQIRNNKDPNLHPISSQAWNEDQSFRSDTEAQTLGARIVDGQDIGKNIHVGEAEYGSFDYFLDGIQKSIPTLYYSTVPVVYGYTSAAIRKRTNCKMTKHEHIAKEALYYPYSLLDSLKDYPSIDTQQPDAKPDTNPMAIIELARKKLSDVRSNLEKDMASVWMKDFQGSNSWLLVDGSLSGDYYKYEDLNVIGVIKSHQTQYLDSEQMRLVFNLKVGERSILFIPQGRNRPDVYSWYLRLRSNEGKDPYYALVRIEAAASKRTLELADELSRWLMAEVHPVSLPDPRWDKMIYPIRDCEMYLKSFAPSKIRLEAWH